MRELIKLRDYYITADISIKRTSPLNIVISHGSNNDRNYKLILDLFNLLKKTYTVLRFNFSYVDHELRKSNARNEKEIKACLKNLNGRDLNRFHPKYQFFLSCTDKFAFSGKHLRNPTTFMRVYLFYNIG
ncbi:MAG: hypothetical protein QXP35_02225 [Candidatus Micrarchaeaceae archaeon]